MKRRHFSQIAAAAVTAVGAGSSAASADSSATGVGKYPFLATFTYGRGIVGRHVPGQPLPDQGKQEYDTSFHGGNYTKSHPEFYGNTVMTDFRAPDHGDFDLLDAVLPETRSRGLKSICWTKMFGEAISRTSNGYRQKTFTAALRIRFALIIRIMPAF